MVQSIVLAGSRAVRAVCAAVLFAVLTLGAGPGPGARSASGPPVATMTAGRLKSTLAADAGKVVVVNFWATYCPPCVAEFPDLVRLYRRYHAEGLEVLPISADSGDDLASKVRPFLRKNGVDFPAYITPESDTTDYITSLDPKWEGALPRTYVIDRKGRVVKTIAGQFDRAELNALVARLLAESKPARGYRPAPHKSGILVD
jgi:thiol-disulfide isomerase/thioredoxin